MAGKLYTTEQIIALLREAEVRIWQGEAIVAKAVVFWPVHFGLAPNPLLRL